MRGVDQEEVQKDNCKRTIKAKCWVKSEVGA